jgi:hypothetical protein
LVATHGPTAGCLLRDRGTAGAARPVELFLRSFFRVVVAAGETPPHRLGFVETVVAVIPAPA